MVCRKCCAGFGHKWDICFNAKKTQMLTLGGNNPTNCRLFLDSRSIAWTSKVKYLGIHILARNVHRVDITDAKRKYYGCFNRILTVCRKVETSLLHYILLNHTVYHACFMVVKACC